MLSKRKYINWFQSCHEKWYPWKRNKAGNDLEIDTEIQSYTQRMKLFRDNSGQGYGNSFERTDYLKTHLILNTIYHLETIVNENYLQNSVSVLMI